MRGKVVGWAGAAVAVAAVAGWLWLGGDDAPTGRDPGEPADPGDRWAEFAGAHFTPEPAVPDLFPPAATPVPVPDFPGAFAVWGAVGRAADGHIWFAAAAHDVEGASAHLFEYDPVSDRVSPRGDAVAELRRAGRHRPGLRQPKIHTKIVPAADGYLYFASTDDPDGQDTTRPPRWGSHLWRHRPGSPGWEHLMTLNEGLLSLVGDGTRLYGLMYPDHQLLQFDTRTRAARRVPVGSADGHVSRHLLCDRRGHAYVPRVRRVRADQTEHTLVEFDPGLREVAEHPLPFYRNTDAVAADHGILGWQPLADGSIAFTTHAGRLFRVGVPAGGGPGRVDDLGWFHPDGRSYASGLFAFAGDRYLVGAAEAKGGWDWVCFDLDARRPTAVPLPLPVPPGQAAADYPFLYGCTTRDDAGHFYLVGGYRRAGGQPFPAVLRLRPEG